MNRTARARMPLRCAGAALALGCGIWAEASAQPLERANAVLLVAKRTITDPNFRRTVLVVTRAPEARTIGVILNRPTQAAVARYFAPDAPAENYRDPVFFGGPVLREVIVALFQTDAAPPHAFRILPRVYLTMQPETIASLLADRNARYRLYAGFSAWAPRQLESELERDSWLVVPASEDLVFRKDTGNLWQELTERASAERVFAPERAPERIRTSQTRSPADAGLEARIARAVPQLRHWYDAEKLTAPRSRADTASSPAALFFTRVPDGRPEFRASRIRGCPVRAGALLKPKLTPATTLSRGCMGNLASNPSIEA